MYTLLTNHFSRHLHYCSKSYENSNEKVSQVLKNVILEIASQVLISFLKQLQLQTKIFKGEKEKRPWNQVFDICCIEVECTILLV